MSSKEKVDLKGLTINKLKQYMKSIDQPQFRAEQVFNWVHKHRVNSFSEMKNIPNDLQAIFTKSAKIGNIEISKHTNQSNDGTIKFLFSLSDSTSVESVLIPPRPEAVDVNTRLTACISTQVGCPLDCKFCATGTINFNRNLTTSEIVDQVIQLQKISKKPITNIVYMGMGEPLLNYDNVMSSIELLTEQKGMGFGSSRITISTAGFADRIRQMGDENRKVKLALSLHSLVDEVRVQIMPITKKFSVKELIDSLFYYQSKTNKSLMFEYILFEKINDRLEDAELLTKVCKKLKARVNIIPFHSIDFTHPEGFAKTLKPSSPERALEFVTKLKQNKVLVFQRLSAGIDIDAACGQLAFTHYQQ
ncbi:MAG: 23S rRNA (adenine(2503)-C(2))-methyltransferase RlmN [Ignavibacteria bacterium]|nr:23S rRNA (adenine(2503)-C(2))-methyltransferase RlmN [Bacteroidota bacterium]MSQ46001.1 23S rRNA (adenine(2503)-C(2))-methyltransferase RlmN [Ignavibacteria bacterium]